ncbi:XRE family transcriptional regulator [Candidatus Arsenophonus triatominarum]|uniref:XRE family transcriptional regulator n=1 Tax=Candidatus Arsenophonus triatominarum TaxID=57911 RepID=UPI0007C542A4|nr:helix-turn-helix transcriptional regulator [Candidatus Arsenophonus triatominarum]
MKTTLAQRLRQARKSAGLSQKELGAAVSVSQAAIQKLESGKALNSTKLINIAKILNVNPEWLSLGLIDDQNSLSKEDSSSILLATNQSNSTNSYKVEVLDIEASAGKGIMIHNEFIETIKSIEYADYEGRKLFGGRPDKSIKIITVKGDSMAKTFEPQDQIFVDTSVNYFDDDGIYVFVLEKQIYIKRLQKQHKKIAIISDNPCYETWYLEENMITDLYIMAKVLISQSVKYKFHG